MERLLGKLYTDAMLHRRKAELAQELPDEKNWYIVVCSTNEAIQAIRIMRGAPEPAPEGRPKHPVIKKPDLDHMGVPALPEEKP